jgi:hypothetical protein
LKSIPVETNARSVRGLRTTPRRIFLRSISPFGLIALLASAGRARLAGSFLAEVQKRLSEIRRDEALAAQQKTSTAA